MRRTATFLLTLGLGAMVGCSITGKWSMTAVEPEAARRDFEYASLTLQKDGSFYAESQQGVPGPDVVVLGRDAAVYAETKKPGIQTTSGTYTFKDGTLTLTPHEGPPATYDAAFKDANHLRLEKFWNGQKVRTVFKRIE